ncbi:MAG: carboxypeptidase regulatory-like domain-containing protein [Microbacterium sp.]|uniref:SdrD B-like domain-containing protein n=1 Tax=Microbacterium sp. TaxID=51671 RepID=UPI00260A7880|nr:SdrD B-like domain-containing protein [Microbacterium sp.]MCX6501438.1 carboxypeptidase regulatory-like domain-containing protein [Microbacterium sp.]
MPRTPSLPHALARPRRWRVLLAATAAIMLVAVGLHVPAPAAAAETGGVYLSVNYGTDTYGGTPVVEPGKTYEAVLRYDASKITPGGTATITVPQGVTFPSGVPAGNTVIDSVGYVGADLVVTFKAEPDTSIAQGMIGFHFTFTAAATHSELRDVTWQLNGVPTTTTIIVKNPGDVFQPGITDGQAKSHGSVNLNSAVTVDANGTVSVSPAVTGIAIPYTLTITSATARTVTITDTIDGFLSHDQTSFSATLTTWDAHGLNKTVSSFPLPAIAVSGQTATLTGVQLPAASSLTISYTAHVRSDRIGDLTAALQAKADAIDPATGGSFSIPLPNAAVIGGVTVDSSVSIGGSIAGDPAPALGRTIVKTSSLAGDTSITLGTNGDLTAPLDVTYTLAADLRPWAGFENTAHELTGNVIVRDTLPAQLQWKTGAFLTLVSGSLTLRSVPATTSDTDFASDAFVGAYRLSADGQKLEINIGRDTSATYTFTARAQISTIVGLPTTTPGTSRPQVVSIHTVTNVAYLVYPGSSTTDRSTVVDTLVVPKPPGSVINDPSEFSKTVGTLGQLPRGAVVAVPFTFTIAAGAVPDLRTSKIIDEIDLGVFNTSDLAGIASTITGSYAGVSGLSGSDFILEMVGGELVFGLSPTFGANLPAASRPATTGALTGRLVFTVTIPTEALLGRESIDVSNSARIEGSGTQVYTWTSQASASASSYGDELEIAKRVYAGNGEWTTGLRAELDADGDLVSDEFIYRVDLISHGDYFGIPILDILDTLPSGMELVGFVADAAVDAGTVTPGTTIDMGANLRATLDRSAGTVLITQQPGTTLPQGARTSVNFKVRVTTFTEDVSITNRIGNTTAVITPSTGFPLVIKKVDAVQDSIVITDRNARFTVTAPDGSVVTDRAYVVDGQLMVAGPGGTDRAIVIPVDPAHPTAIPSGRYIVTEQVAPAGYETSSAQVVATIRADGSSAPVTFFDTPASLYAIGDVVWIDQDRDGVQDASEPRLAGVAVQLRDAASGAVVADTTTDADGQYLFDLLPEGRYTVTFTLTAAQAAQYRFTETLRGGDVTLDSDAERRTGTTGVITLDAANPQLVKAADYAAAHVRALHGIDPTWDAGVVELPGTATTKNGLSATGGDARGTLLLGLGGALILAVGAGLFVVRRRGARTL